MEWRRDQERKRHGAENKASLNFQQLSRPVTNNEAKAPVDKEKLRALFYPDSDSDDDPIAAIKRKQIAANKRRRELAAVADADRNNTKSIDRKDDDLSEDNKFTKRRCTKRQDDIITSERKEVEKPASIRSDAVDLTVEDNLTKDATSTPKLSQSDLSPKTSSLTHASTLSSKTSSLQQATTLRSVKEMTITKKAIGEESNGAVRETDRSTNTKVDKLNEDASTQKLLTESAAAPLPSTMKAPAQVTPASSAPATPAETRPIVAKEVKTPKSVTWTALHSQNLLVRSPVVFNPRDKVAAFDLDQTLANWNVPPGSWPSSIQQYELWNSSVIDKLRKLDKDGYKLVIFSNQGGIKGALHGKIAARVKCIIDWVAKKVGRPIFALCSTMSGSEYHKPNSGMWQVMESRCNAGVEVRIDSSFFVGDSDGTGEGYQLQGVDKAFAQNVGRLRNAEMKFYTPKEFFGESNLELRSSALPKSEMKSYNMPKRATAERAALLGGYLTQPLLLILVGVQGSGKTSFCQTLGQGWCHLSQDTINSGRPGERKDVELAARSILKQKQKSVVIDRMHLDAAQRQYFVQIGKEAGVNVHCLVFVAAKDDITKRVKERTNHPGGVEGEQGAKLAVASLSKLIKPTYNEGFALINHTHSGISPIMDAYRSIGSNAKRPIRKSIILGNCDEKLQMITLGTFKLKKQDVSSTISLASRLGINSLDTAPTYENEVEIGNSLRSHEHKVSVIVKVPKRATTATQAREEVMRSLSALKLKCADIVLLHWPSDLIESGTLVPVWKELESMKESGICKTLGVCNFSVSALQMLISSCTIKPQVNQVERHPLLPQYELLDYCSSEGIVVQAHSPLGGGNLLQHSTIQKVAKESGKVSPAQCCLLWNIQQGVPVVVKCSSPTHLREITALLHDGTDGLALSANHMKELHELSKQNHRFVAPKFMLRPKAIYSWEDTAVQQQYIEPAIPNPQFSIGVGEEKLPFIMFMAVREKKPSVFSDGIKACENSCPPSVHSHCFQRAGTRHITLFQGDLSKNQARMLRYEQDHTGVDVSLPLNIDFDGWMPWEAGCYLSVEQSCRRKLESLVDKIVGLPKGSRKCNHMSLYRRRKWPRYDEFGAAVKRIKTETSAQHWGSVEGVSIRLKIMHDAYEDCIVLAGLP